MTLSQFITDNIEPILAEWEAFAKSLPAGQGMSATDLRDDAERMLRFVAADMEGAQSENERASKGRGQQPVGSDGSAADAHGHLRQTQAFDLPQMVSEFRALRASVIRLWSKQMGETPLAPSELIRFNEAIDQILGESVNRYASDLERSRELLLAVLGHDLRNPLSAVRVSAEVLTRTSLTPRQNELTSGIIRGSERMRRMVHDLLDFTRARLGAKLALSLERCDLDAVCRNIVDETRSAFPNCEVIIESSGDCVGSWDCERLAQLVSNLVGNAVQHGDKNGPVKITTAGDEPESVTLVVANRGPAIHVEGRLSLFDPLNRIPYATDRSQTGSLGLGLYIAREIALAHGGGLELLSSDESGTLFKVRLPRVAIA